MRGIGLLVWIACAGCVTGEGSDDDTLPTDPFDPQVLEDAPARSCDVTLEGWFDPGTRVAVAGRFNDWIPSPMDAGASEGQFTKRLGRLVPGTYGYKFVFDYNSDTPTWETPPPDVYTSFEGGVENRALVVGDCRVPSLRARSASASADGTLTASFDFLRAEDGPGLDPDSVVVEVGGEVVSATINVLEGTIDVELTGLAPGKHSVRVRARDGNGDSPAEGQAFVPLWVEAEPFDWQDGLLYYVFTDRFRDGGDDGMGPIAGAQYGTDYMGGDLVGAREAMEEGWFEALGVRSIWLSPINDNPEGAFPGSFNANYTGYHGYWPISARGVENRLGTLEVSGEQALHDFIDAAHARGIRVLFDTVLNHVHQEHEFLQQSPEWFTASPCPCTTDPGTCNWDSNPIGCWFTDYLPDLDYKNQEIVDAMLEDARYWVEEFDVDGFRVDAAKHMDHVIMRSLSLKLTELYEDAGGPEMYLVGETFTFLGGQGLIMDYVAEHELHGQFDFPLYYAIRQSLLNNEWRTISNEMHAGDTIYGGFVDRMSPFMGNHDISRFATDIHGCPNWALFGGCPDVMAEPGEISGAQWDVINRMSVGFALVSMQPGVPLLYYGDEVGLAGAGDPDNRRLMPWGTLTPAQTALLERLRALGTLRTQHDVLKRGTRQELWVADNDDLFVFARTLGSGQTAIIAMRQDLTGASRTQWVPLPSELGLEGVTMTDALKGTRVVTASGGGVELTLDPWEYVVLLAD
ncbi:MAG: alpha-amylase family glycosyl hydrolase [Myxococcota bacterium]